MSDLVGAPHACECKTCEAIRKAREVVATWRARPLPRGTMPPPPLVWYDVETRAFRQIA